jgi:hypothetical protein
MMTTPTKAEVMQPPNRVVPTTPRGGTGWRQPEDEEKILFNLTWQCDVKKKKELKWTYL